MRTTIQVSKGGENAVLAGMRRSDQDSYQLSRFYDTQKTDTDIRTVV
jgi:hypothetical protein